MLIAGYLLVVVVVDCLTRRYPWWLLGIGIGVLGYLGEVSTAGLILGGLLCLVADMPGGDFRFAMVFGAMIGPVVIVWTIAGAFVVTLIAWRIGFVGMPWTVYIGLVYGLISTMQSIM